MSKIKGTLQCENKTKKVQKVLNFKLFSVGVATRLNFYKQLTLLIFQDRYF